MSNCNGLMILKAGNFEPPVSRLRTRSIVFRFDAPPKLENLIKLQSVICAPTACGTCAFDNSTTEIPSGCKKLEIVRHYLSEAQQLPSSDIRQLIDTCRDTIATADVEAVFKSIQTVFEAVSTFALRYQSAPHTAPPIEVSIFTPQQRKQRRVAEAFNQLFPRGKPPDMDNSEVESKLIEHFAGRYRISRSTINRVKQQLKGDWPPRNKH